MLTQVDFATYATDADYRWTTDAKVVVPEHAGQQDQRLKGKMFKSHQEKLSPSAMLSLRQSNDGKAEVAGGSKRISCVPTKLAGPRLLVDLANIEPKSFVLVGHVLEP